MVEDLPVQPEEAIYTQCCSLTLCITFLPSHLVPRQPPSLYLSKPSSHHRTSDVSLTTCLEPIVFVLARLTVCMRLYLCPYLQAFLWLPSLISWFTGCASFHRGLLQRSLLTLTQTVSWLKARDCLYSCCFGLGPRQPHLHLCVHSLPLSLTYCS